MKLSFVNMSLKRVESFVAQEHYNPCHSVTEYLVYAKYIY